jgi:hypothetical protein
MMQLGQGMMNQNDMRSMMQNNSIAPVAEAAHPVQNHLQVPYAQPLDASPVIAESPVIAASPVGSDAEEIDADIAPGNVTEALTQGEHTSKLVDLYTQNGYTTTTATNSQLGGMLIAQLKALMTKVLDDDIRDELIIQYGIGKRTKQIRKDGLTLEDLAKDILNKKNS